MRRDPGALLAVIRSRKLTEGTVMPTEKQIEYALALMAKKGYDTRFMSAKHKELGATMRQRSGGVRDWLQGMTRPEISALIDKLKE